MWSNTSTPMFLMDWSCIFSVSFTPHMMHVVVVFCCGSLEQMVVLQLQFILFCRPRYCVSDKREFSSEYATTIEINLSTTIAECVVLLFFSPNNITGILSTGIGCYSTSIFFSTPILRTEWYGFNIYRE